MGRRSRHPRLRRLSLVGAIVGQLTLGYVGDCLGRPRALQITMALSVLGALASAFAVPLDAARPETIFHFLSITRFVLGVGVGGVYPLSATIASEAASKESRGRTASLVFSMQGVASLLVPLLAMLLVALCGTPKVDARGDDLGLSWRLLLGLGALPGILLAPFKARSASAEEAKRNSNINGAAQVHSSRRRRSPSSPPTPAGGARRRRSRCCRRCASASTGGSWWGRRAAGSSSTSPSMATRSSSRRRAPKTLHRVADSGAILARFWRDSGAIPAQFGGAIPAQLGAHASQRRRARLAQVLKDVFNSTKAAGPTPVTGDLSSNVLAQVAVVAAIGLPGYYVSVGLMDILGRKKIQLQGFFFMAVVFGALGIFDAQLEDAPAVMLILYGLTFFFSNFGPNSTTFILPAETFPFHLRTTLNGFSAAMGKAGATLGSAGFKSLFHATNMTVTMLVCAAISLVGLAVTVFFVEDRRGKDMEEGAEEDEGAAPRRRSKPRRAGAPLKYTCQKLTYINRRNETLFRG